MSDNSNQQRIFTLHQLLTSVQNVLSKYSNKFWIVAEMNKLNHYSYSGHAYPELVEKSNNKVIAQAKAIIWSSDLLRINNNFLKTIQEPLKDGVKILFLASISFSPEHGFSLIISDIDPSYTLGDLEQEKRNSIEKLKANNLFNKNKKLDFPLLAKRIAIISVETSKGYADFNNIIDNNERGYKFVHKLFPAILQGDKAIDSIKSQLFNIEQEISNFDLVVIIRGGGGDVGLSCYNNYSLAEAVANFPIPVITGIGHATNETVIEMVSYKNGITPTKVAELLIQNFNNYVSVIEDAEVKMVRLVEKIISTSREKLNHNTRYLGSVLNGSLAKHHSLLNNISVNLDRNIKVRISRDVHHLEFLGKGLTSLIDKIINNQRKDLEYIGLHVKNMGPEAVLKRGYSILLHNGKSINSIENINKGDKVVVVLGDGEVGLTIDKIKKK